MGRSTEDLTGKQFGKWIVLQRDCEYKCNDYNAYWLCRCVCGIEKPVNGSHLRLGKSTSCRQCSEHKHKNKICSRIWARIYRNSKRRDILVNLGEEGKQFLYDLLYVKQECKCALSGLPIKIANTVKEDMLGETTASLDRIDPKKGYTRDNVQWVHKWINAMKWDLEQEEFIEFCEAVVKHKENRWKIIQNRG